PRHDAVAPPEVARLVDRLACERFGDQYDVRTGIVRLRHPQRLREALADIPEGRRKDAHVRYFLERNPGWSSGDELVCLADLSDANLTAAGRRMLRGTPA